MNSLTFKEAAILILTDAEKPLTAKEIWDVMDQRNLVTSEAKQPWNIVYNTLVKHSYRNLREPEADIIFRTIDSDVTRFELASIQRTDLILKVVTPELNWKQIEVKEREGRIFYEVDDCEEYTYFIHDPAHAAIKIGRTTNSPDLRLSNLRTANPALELLHVVPSDRFPEKELHERFDEFRRDREWFFATRALEAFIEAERQKSDLVWKAYETYQEHRKIVTDLLDIIR